LGALFLYKFFLGVFIPKLQILFFLLLLTSCSSAPIPSEEKYLINNPTEKIINAFKKRHGNTIATFYGLNNGKETLFEVDFLLNNKSYSESYDSEGKLLETEYQIKLNDISENLKNIILSDLAKRYSDYKIHSIQIVKSEMLEQFEFKIKTRQSKTGILEVFYKQDGTWLKQNTYQLKRIETLN
jgi:hypothetical protein